MYFLVSEPVVAIPVITELNERKGVHHGYNLKKVMKTICSKNMLQAKELGNTELNKNM